MTDYTLLQKTPRLYKLRPVRFSDLSIERTRRRGEGRERPISVEKTQHEAKPADALSWLANTLMLAPWVVRLKLTFMSAATLAMLVAELHASDPKLRREAREVLGLSDDSKKKRKDDDDDDDDDDDRDRVAKSIADFMRPRSPLFINAPVVLAAQHGWHTLSVLAATTTHRAGRLGLKAVNAIGSASPHLMGMLNAPSASATDAATVI